MWRVHRRLRAIPWLHNLARRSLMMYHRWRFGLTRVHPTFYMARGCLVASDLVAAEYSFINSGCMIGPRVTLGRYVMMGAHVAVVGKDHVTSQPGIPMIFAGRTELKETIIEDDVWIGYGAIIIAGVRIGRGAIVGAGSVVTKNIPPYEVHAGVPAQKIGDRFALEADRLRHDAMLKAPPVAGQYCALLV